MGLVSSVPESATSLSETDDICLASIEGLIHSQSHW
jgi:hypothetical protein